MHLTIVLGVHPDHGQHFEQDFGLGIGESAVPAIPAGSVQIQPVDVDAFVRWSGDVVLHPLGHFVAQNHAVQGPAFVSASDLLQRLKNKIVKYCTEIGLSYIDLQTAIVSVPAAS